MLKEGAFANVLAQKHKSAIVARKLGLKTNDIEMRNVMPVSHFHKRFMTLSMLINCVAIERGRCFPETR